MKILITGGAGFIGSNLSLKLTKNGHAVTILDNLSPQIHGDEPEKTSPLYKSVLDANIAFINGSVTDKETWIKAIEGQEAIIHLAAETGTGQSMYEIQRYTDVNIGATAMLLDILANTSHTIKRIVIASSRSIYGEGKYSTPNSEIVYPSHRAASDMDKKDFEVKYTGVDAALTLLPTDETSKIHPSSVYGITKQVQEQLIMTVCPTIGVIPVAFRYQNVYGPGQSLSNPYTGILSIFSTLIRSNKGINVFEDGEESRDFVFIDDVVDATILGIENEASNNQVFNVGYGEATNVITVANTLINEYGINVPVNISGNYRLGDIRHNYADISKIKTLLNFEPRFDFKTGIALFCDWVRGQEVIESKFDDSIKELKERGLIK
jgi:dTDP-L-rhamnose 4-epimerase